MNMQPSAPPLVVDVCGTLVHDDTTLGLLRFHFARNSVRKWRSLVLSATTTRRSPLWILVAVAERLTGTHILKHILVRLLAGDTLQSLQDSADRYAELLLRERKVDAVWQVLENESEGRRLVLASASLSPVVAALARSMKADYVSSELEVRDGRLTGKYRKDVTGSKAAAIADALGATLLANGYVAISDNFTDRDLLAGAERAYVVLRQPAHRERWVGLAATFLEAGA
ncbi:MAG TPA: HAD family hydrolase [Terriglobales bacterium]|nr:HAD family hydrolase [Terriglobales bacterium]